MAAIEPPHQRVVVVAVVRGDRLAAGQELANIAMLRHYLLDQWAGLSIAGITIEDLEYVREGADQHLGRLALALTN